MTFEQLAIFIAVAEREHLTRAADAIHLTPSAVSSAIRKLEAFYRVTLFNRIGRRIELTPEGRAFLPEARAVLARAKAAELMLAEMGGLARGSLAVRASQTVASYWLPQMLMRFHADHPGINLALTTGNTATVTRAVLDGEADLGFVEGPVDEPALSVTRVADDEVVVVVAPDHPWAAGQALEFGYLAESGRWVMREAGSGTRAVFEDALATNGIDRARLVIVLELPSNEAVLSAVRTSGCAAAVSRISAETLLLEGHLVRANIALPARQFSLLRHKERRVSKAAQVLTELCLSVSDAPEMA
ncbi:LysR substrate-binding domain-containing protein [Ciceribacter sp. L1K22]|uniref:LysR substrate-binding domain-containing protein n=1 Tax=Ciceribacter sp. L1K22 TaxID=2820275 RepID=UPI001ABEAD2E|nr:LysR substrate-binding domain-containing protein [Ciceribacter sp. L1K22]MBO3759011.1 LysR family transcriptional regulator [Ciceribacter sp. L1K22]